MTTKLAVICAAGAVAVAAASAGGYLVLHSNSSQTAQTVPAKASEPAPPAVDTTSGAVVDDHPAAPDHSATPGTEPAAAPSSARAASSSSSPASPAPAPVIAPRAKPAASKPAASARPDAPAATPSPLPVYTPELPQAENRDAKFDLPPATPIEPPKPRFDDVMVKEDSVIGIRLDSTISTATAKVEDKVTAHVVRDVTVDGRTAIPSNARLEGVVAVVERAGKFKDRARLGIKFQSLLLADGTRTPIQTEMIFREGDSPTGAATSKVGASAVVGTILGAAIGGKKGAAIGATVGAAGGTAAVMASDQKEAVLTAGTPLTVRLTGPVTVSVERGQDR